jgi:hypothetical protein
MKSCRLYAVAANEIDLISMLIAQHHGLKGQDAIFDFE